MFQSLTSGQQYKILDPKDKVLYTGTITAATFSYFMTNADAAIIYDDGILTQLPLATGLHIELAA